jgi:predicted  nucleic acid-binding Zn-ribbon protein
MLCVIVLSSTLTQTRLSTITVDGVNLSIWKLDSVGRQWAGIRRLIQSQSAQLAETQRDRVEKSARANNAQQRFLAQKIDYEQMLQEFHDRIAGIDPQLAGVIEKKPYPEQTGYIKAAKGQLHASHPELDATIASIEAASDALAKTEAERDAAQINFDVVTQKIKDLTDGIGQDTKSLDTVFDLIKPNIDQESRSRVENAMYELYFDTNFTSVVLKPIITAPTDLLILSLVILMGILGSALQMTYAYFVKNQTMSVGGYFLRLSVGAITALVIFIVAKAGVPVVADTSRLGGDAPINPYLVSFLAIISGLLSENAIASVQAQGAKFFGAGTDGPDRWTRSDLTGDLQAQNLSLTDLAAYLGVGEDVAAAQLKGEAKIAAAQQKVIAIYLRRNPRDIYTDIPPPAKG